MYYAWCTRVGPFSLVLCIKSVPLVLRVFLFPCRPHATPQCKQEKKRFRGGAFAKHVERKIGEMDGLMGAAAKTQKLERNTRNSVPHPRGWVQKMTHHALHVWRTDSSLD